jgi:tRNA dimethylallyltransferase
MCLQKNNGQKKHKVKSEKSQPLVVILGPTAVGKTELSIKLTERFDGEIVSADSRLFYRYMDIGTAKPTLDERARVPHHLIDIADPDQILSLGTYKELAQRAIHEIHDRENIPFLVGGTGQYIRAVYQGWRIPKVKPDSHLRSVLEIWADEVGKEGLHYRLSILDPQAAKRIDYRNLRRTVRALEVIFTTGKRYSKQRKKDKSPYQTLLIGLTRPREELYKRVDARIENMLASGLVDEVQNLLYKGYSPELPSFSAIGYREIMSYLSGKISLDNAIKLIKRNTRVFVRRQANWFKAQDSEINWFTVHSGVLDQMYNMVVKWLSKINCIV